MRLVRPLLIRPGGSLQFHRPRAMKRWELVGASKMNAKADLLGVPLFESTSLSPLLLPPPFSVTETSSRQHRVTQVWFRFVYVTQCCLYCCLCTCVSLKRASRTQPASYRWSRRKPADRVRQALPFYPPQPGLDSDLHWQAAPRRAVLRSASTRRAAPLQRQEPPSFRDGGSQGPALGKNAWGPTGCLRVCEQSALCLCHAPF